MSTASAAASSNDHDNAKTTAAATGAATTAVATAPAVPPPMLLLSESAVMAALSMADAIHINAQAFLAVSATAQTQVPDYAAIHTHAAQQSHSQSESDSQSQQQQQQPSVPADATLFKPALLDEALGIKVVAIRPVRQQLSAECGCAA